VSRLARPKPCWPRAIPTMVPQMYAGPGSRRIGPHPPNGNQPLASNVSSSQSRTRAFGSERFCIPQCRSAPSAAVKRIRVLSQVSAAMKVLRGGGGRSHPWPAEGGGAACGAGLLGPRDHGGDGSHDDEGDRPIHAIGRYTRSARQWVLAQSAFTRLEAEHDHPQDGSAETSASGRTFERV